MELKDGMLIITSLYDVVKRGHTRIGTFLHACEILTVGWNDCIEIARANKATVVTITTTLAAILTI